jgi:Amt family ammonium transporter
MSLQFHLKNRQLQLSGRSHRPFFWWLARILLVATLIATWHGAVSAQPPAVPTITSTNSASSLAQLQGLLNAGWVLVAAILVIFMNAGFAMLETGLCRQKNAVNILSKNLIVFGIATLVYWAFGFGLMFGSGNGIIGWNGFFLNSQNSATYGLEQFPLGIPLAVFFLFEMAFAGTSATIVSGAVAERVTFLAFLIFSVFKVLTYSVIGHWAWGNGWLEQLGFIDFAGSTVVHAAGGWAALAGVAILGPRQGKYQRGQIQPLPGHNLSLATLGCFILWIGWFGFNGGSEMALNTQVFSIVVNSNLAAAAGGLVATLISWTQYGKPDLSLTINGTLAGLVSITASCNDVTYVAAIAIGGIAGLLVVQAIFFFDRLRLDDPVGALSVHLVNGIWGTLAVAIFGSKAGVGQLGIQLLGSLAIGGFTFLVSCLIWLGLKATVGIRVSAEEELEGLDFGEHGMEAYSGFLKDS